MKTIIRKFHLSSFMIRIMTMTITLSMILASQLSVSRTFAFDDWEYGDAEWDNDMVFDDYEDSYPVEEASQLNGLFKLSSDGQTLTQIFSEDEPGTTIESYDGKSVDWWLCSSYPTEIARGEKLVLAGTEWGNRSENDKKAGVMYYQELNFLGYTNLVLSDMNASDIETLNGIDISGINDDLASVNSAISGEGLKYHEYFVLNDSFTPKNLLLCVISLIVVPFLTLGIDLLLPVSNMVLVIHVFLMAMPSAAIITVLCSRYNKNAKLAAEGAASTTFFSLGTLALWTLFLTEMFL